MELHDVTVEIPFDKKESKTIVTDLSKANWAFRNLVAIENGMKEIEDLAKAELDRINNWKKEELKVLQGNKEFFDFQLEQYYREQREIDSKFKLSTPYGKVTSRKQQPKWNYDDEVIIDSLKSKGISHLIETEIVEKLPKKEFKESVEILKDVVSLNGIIKENIKPYHGQEGFFVDVETGELQDTELNYKHHKQAVVYKGKVIEGVTVEERDYSVTVKAVF